MRLTAFFKLYKICILLHRCNLKILAKNRFGESAIFVKIQQKFCKCCEICKICQISKDSIRWSGRFWKMLQNAYLYSPVGGSKNASLLFGPPKKSFVGCVSKPFSKQMWRPEMRWWDDGMMWCRDDGMMWWWNHRMMEAIFGPFLGHFSWISEEIIKEMGGGVGMAVRIEVGIPRVLSQWDSPYVFRTAVRTSCAVV